MTSKYCIYKIKTVMKKKIINFKFASNVKIIDKRLYRSLAVNDLTVLR